MNQTEKITETWLSRPPGRGALDFTLALGALLLLGAFAFLGNLHSAADWMPASQELVFGSGQYWRLWSTLFAHGDLGHILSNILLFLPFSYFLAGHVSRSFFPGLAFLNGGLINALVLLTMPKDSFLIGISGVVYWMGAAWLTLYLLIERHEPRRRRWGKVILVTTVLFIPESFRPEVSYLIHLLGFLTGAISAAGYFAFHRKEIAAAERRELVTLGDWPPMELEEWPQE